MPEARRQVFRSSTAALPGVAVTALLAGCGTGARAGGPGGMTLPRGRAVWLLPRYALGALVADPAVRAGLAGSPIYEILQPGQQPLPGVKATPVVPFRAVAPRRKALPTGPRPAGTRAVLYDPEAWSFTPAGEQRDPARAAATARGLARAPGPPIIRPR